MIPSMGLLTDILKEIPQAAVLKEKIATIEAKYAAADTENAILKDDLRQAQTEIAKLKKQVEDLTAHEYILSDTELEMLRLVFWCEHGQTFLEAIASRSPQPKETMRYHLLNLAERGYISVDESVPSLGARYDLTQKSRKALIDRGWYSSKPD